MLLADTSAWIEFLRATGSAQARRLRRAIAGQEVVVIDPILLEVMAGARGDSVPALQRLMIAQHVEEFTPRLDWLDAARIYRRIRRQGETVRSQVDALIAAVAIRLDVPVLHRDRDYDTIARHVSLRIVPT